jgi:hypothetical protein
MEIDIKAKNAEHLGLRFSISFLRMKDEPGSKDTTMDKYVNKYLMD